MPGTIRTVIFDFGNVVAFFDHGRAVAEFARHTDVPPAELEVSLYSGRLADDYERGTISTADYVRHALDAGRLRCSPDEFVAAYTNIFWPNPEVIALLPRLKPRQRLVLGSNTNDAHYRRYAADFAAELGHFDHVVVSHEAGARKPEPAFFRYALRFAAADPGECLFVDDLPANVAAAEAAGLRGLVYTPDGSLTDKLRAAGIEVGSNIP